MIPYHFTVSRNLKITVISRKKFRKIFERKLGFYFQFFVFFNFQISIIFQGHHMVILLDMIVLNHIVTLIMMFEEDVAPKHGK